MLITIQTWDMPDSPIVLTGDSMCICNHRRSSHHGLNQWCKTIGCPCGHFKARPVIIHYTGGG